jgi:hypothetical protein
MNSRLSSRLLALTGMNTLGGSFIKRIRRRPFPDQRPYQTLGYCRSLKSLFSCGVFSLFPLVIPVLVARCNVWQLQSKTNMYETTLGRLMWLYQSGTMHSRAHPRTVSDRTTILSLRPISICVCLFLQPRPPAERVYADAK